MAETVSVIRAYRHGDLARMRQICVRTGAAGTDATGRWSSDELLPDVYLEPYVTAAPDWAWVVDEGNGPLGYLVATPNTRRFVAWWKKRWTPWFAERYPAPGTGHPSMPLGDEDALVQRGHDPSHLLVPEVDEYPAHLHIDLLPEAQGRGYGRALIENALIPALAQARVPGVHLGVDPANTTARSFYVKVGFEELPSSAPDAPLLGRWISPRPSRGR